MTASDFVKTCIKTNLRPSKIDGIGVFALVPIKKGEQVFPTWQGESGWYKEDLETTKSYPQEVLYYILRSFGTSLVHGKTIVNFKLTKGCPFLLTEPQCFVNIDYKKRNMNSITGIALTDIEKDTEILGTYSYTVGHKLIDRIFAPTALI